MMPSLSAQLGALLEAAAAGPSVVVDKVRHPVVIAWEGPLVGSDRPGTTLSHKGALAVPAGFDGEILLLQTPAKKWMLVSTYEWGRKRLHVPGNILDDPALRALDHRVQSAVGRAADWRLAIDKAVKKG
jgi:hypothetical protein